MPMKTYETSEPFDTSIRAVNTTDNNTTSTVTGLIPATRYTVFLSAFTGAGEGDNSSSVINDTDIMGNK